MCALWLNRTRNQTLKKPKPQTVSPYTIEPLLSATQAGLPVTAATAAVAAPSGAAVEAVQAR